MSPPNPITVHAESARVGMRIALHHITGNQPSEDTVRALVHALPQAGVNPVDFPLPLLEHSARERSERRRIWALKAMEILLHHAGDSMLLTSEQLREVATKAWTMAAAMEGEENTASQLDSIRRS